MSVLTRLLEPSRGNLPAEYAREVLAMDFTPAELARYSELCGKLEDDALSEPERRELEELLLANELLTILHAKAKLSLGSSAA